MPEIVTVSMQEPNAGTTAQPAPKRIIICCDGTWLSSVTTKTTIPSNITRIARYLSKAGRDQNGREWQQLLYYDAGIGTGPSVLADAHAAITGLGFNGNVIEAYNFIVLNYNLGDEIFCFGFSRGAYTARAVAGLVTDIGVIRPRDMQDFPELYRHYLQQTDSHGFRKSAAWRHWVAGSHGMEDDELSFGWGTRAHTAIPESTRWVEAVGVFETVGSLGIPRVDGMRGFFTNIAGLFPNEEVGFHNVALSPFIKHAYHALALDEHREPFMPTLWHHPANGIATKIMPQGSSSDLQKAWHEIFQSSNASDMQLEDAWANLIDAQMYEELQNHRSHLVQVWFPGVHINVGGGNSDLLDNFGIDSDFEQISTITFTWMVDQLKHHLAFEENLSSILDTDRFHTLQPIIDRVVEGNVAGHWLREEISDKVTKFNESGAPDSDPETYARLTATKILRGWATCPIGDSYQGLMLLGGSKYRSPGRSFETRLQDGAMVKLGPTDEYIHPTVKYRMDILGDSYRPQALRGFVRQARRNQDGRPIYNWVDGDVVIPEWEISSLSNFERACVVDDASKAYLNDLDEYYAVEKSA